MYLDFYGLKESPFNITSNPDFFFESSSHKEAFSALLYGIHQKKGIILITGEVGTGKTTLCKTLLKKFSRDIKISFILNPYFSEVQLLNAIIQDFGLATERKSRLDIVNTLNSFLVDTAIKRGNAVLIIDEEQNLSLRQLEQIRLLSNLETSHEKLLQIILMGQPELMEKLKLPQLRQIYQRIFIKYTLYPLKEEEIRAYVEFRLQKAGRTDIDILPESFQVIYEFSKGIPRLVNMLCDRALLLGFAREIRVLNEEVFRICIEEIK